MRKIVSAAAEHDYRIQSLIVGVAQSYPFVMRRAATPNDRPQQVVSLRPSSAQP